MTGPVTLRTAHTADLAADELRAARTLLETAFRNFDEHDWEHTLGGVHALVWDGKVLVGHGSVVQRRLVHRGRALRAGYVEAVAVRADRRGEGHGARVMSALERVVRRAYDLGALSTSDAGAGLYAARGWLPWRGSTWVLSPDGLLRTADEDRAVRVLPVDVPIDLDGSLACDWREGDVW